MGRDVKDELNQEEPARPEESILPDIQLQVSPDMQENLLEIVKDDFKNAKDYRDKLDYGSTSKGERLDFEKFFKGIKDLYNGERIAKEIPWKFCSNRSLKIAAAILDMLHARLVSAIINSELLRWRALSYLSTPKKERINKLMYWWIWVHSRMRNFFDNWVKAMLGFGETIVESSWQADPIDKGQIKETPVTDEMGQPLINPDGTAAIMKEAIIDLDEYTTSRIYLRDAFFLQEGSRDIRKEPVVLKSTLPYRELEKGEAQGKYINVTTKLRDVLPKGLDFDTSVPDEEQARLQDIKIRNMNVNILTWYGNFDADGDGFEEDVRIYISEDHDIYLGGMAVKNITKFGKRPIKYSKLEARIGNLEENWGIGVLEKVRELAEELDAIFNQMTDGNTLAIMTPIFYDPSGDLDAQAFRIQPNKATPVSDPQRNVYIPTFNVQTEKLINAIRLVLEFIERLTAASSYVLGKESEIVGGSGTATRTNAIMQSAEQRFALPAERLREGASGIILNHLDLLQLNIPPGLEERILGDDGEPIFQPNELSALGISGEFDCFLLPDPSEGSKDMEREISTMLYSLAINEPIVATDIAKRYKFFSEVLKAWGKDPKEYLGPEPEMDMVDDPKDENTLVLQGQYEKVKAMLPENHMLHIKDHSDFLQSPALKQLPSALAQAVVQFLTQHIQEHMQMMQMIMQMTAQGGSGESGGKFGNSKGPGESSGAPGMEQIPGPLGQTLNEKREGESGMPSFG